MEAAIKLSEGFYEIVFPDRDFLKVDLPDFLEVDFDLAKSLFSVGFDETAVLIAGQPQRGLHQRPTYPASTRFGVGSHFDSFGIFEGK
ncbi:MAG TPA: hypothetical protein VNU68_22320 [Verrucomicrobiae bacterium]|nr:hypothetical protein [Verrucomicrobiae bacterium]